ncbi:MAG TPA: PKD domain-containing protein, partial [Naasia sp.]
PPNTAPTAAFTWAADGLTVTADSAPSSDSDGSIVARSWDLAGVAATGATASRTFPAPGTYPVTLTVTDDDGASASTTQSVTVTAAPAPNTAPTAAFTWAADGLTVTVDSAPSTDSDGTIASRTWDLGGTAATGTTASRTFPASGTYPVTLTVTDDDGAAASSTQSVTVTAPPPPGGGTLASDAFARTVASGWGAADAGGTWTVNAAARFSASGGTGRIAANAGSTLTATLGQVTGSALDTRVVVAADRVPNQVLSITVAGRTVGTSTYGGRVRINPNGSVQLHVMRDGTALAGNTLPGIAYTAGMRLHIRVQVDGTNPTTVRTKVWRDGTAEPGAWQYSATDSSAALQQPGSPRLISYLSSAATNGPVSLTVDDLVVTASG